jgi:hypothetical protein
MIFKIGDESKAYKALAERWALPQALMQGTQAMRDNAKEFLPMWPMENPLHYHARVASSTLYNAFKRTNRVLAAKPFSEAVKVIEIPAELEVLETDIDRNGLTLTQFCHKQLTDKLTYGLQYFLVDNPAYDPETTTRADQMAKNIHPYFCRVQPDSIIYWNIENDDTGKSTLVELHIRTCETDANDEEWSIITVWEPGMVTRYKKPVDQDGKTKVDYSLDVQRENPLGVIPLVVTYSIATQTDEMQATSPLEDLAWLNLRHYQSQSDQDTALHYARVPFLHFAGFDKDEVNRVVAANNAFVSKNPQAKIAWIEPTGNALAQGFKDLEALEIRMDVMGADLLAKQKSGNPTATAKTIDTAEKQSDLQSMVVSLEAGIVQGYKLAAMWLNLTDPNIDIEMNTDFGLSLNDVAELNFLLKARLAGEISRELFYQEIIRRGLFDEFDPDEEAARVAVENANAVTRPIPTSGNPGGAP